MNYPLISEYIESIKAAEDNFEELTSLRAVLGGDGQPVMTSGNFAVVFKMKNVETGKLYALKCFTKEQEGRAEAYHQIADELKDVDSPYFVSLRYLEKELFVDTNQTDETEFPVLLMDWVEGKTLDKYLRENLDDKYALEMLAYRFSQLAQWLIPQPFAHGDLKPDNIIVQEEGSLVLVDYDGMYVPAMKGQKARELGSPDFRHPQRTENDFNEHIDEFSIVSISLSLSAILQNTELINEFGEHNRLLFSEKDYLNICDCGVLKRLFSSNDVDINRLAVAFQYYVLNSSQARYPILTLLNHGLRPELTRFKEKYYSLNKYVDEYGVEYTHDKKILLSWHNFLNEEIDFPNSYDVLEGTEIICDEAFMFCENLETIKLPKSLRYIGYSVFVRTKVSHIQCDSSVFMVEDNILYSYDKRVLYYYPENKKDTYFEVPEQVKKIVKGCFSNSEYLWIVNLKHIYYDFYDFAFDGKYISIPKGTLKYIDFDYTCGPVEDKYEIRKCIFEGDLIVDKGVVYSSDKTVLYRFPYWLDFEEYHVDEKCKIIEEAAFDDSFGTDEYGQNIRFNKLKSLYLPPKLEEIKDYAFVGCGYLENLTIPPTVKRVGNFVFGQCVNLTTLTFLSKIENINKESFNIGIKMPAHLVNPYEPYAIRNYSKCEVDILICPNGTEDYYKELLCNNNTCFFSLSVNGVLERADNIECANTNGFFLKHESNLSLLPDLEDKLLDIVYEINDSEDICEHGFWIDFSKLKKLIENAIVIFDIFKPTNRFYGRQYLSGICYTTKDYQTKFVNNDIPFVSKKAALNFASRIYYDVNG